MVIVSYFLTPPPYPSPRQHFFTCIRQKILRKVWPFPPPNFRRFLLTAPDIEKKKKIKTDEAFNFIGCAMNVNFFLINCLMNAWQRHQLLIDNLTSFKMYICVNVHSLNHKKNTKDYLGDCSRLSAEKIVNQLQLQCHIWFLDFLI